MKTGRPVLAHRNHENRAVGTKLTVNDRGGRHANFRCYLTTTMVIRGYFTEAKQRNAPKDVGGVGIERIHAAVLGGDYQHIVVSIARNRNTGSVKRLCVHFAIGSEDPQLAEMIGVEVGRLQNLLVQGLSRPRVVVVEGQHVRHLRPRARRGGQKRNQPWRQANRRDGEKLPSGGTFHGVMIRRVKIGAPWGIHPILLAPPSPFSRRSVLAFGCPVVYVRATAAPSSANRFAIAVPIPLDPPVTNATVPVVFFVISSLRPPRFWMIVSGSRFATREGF